MRDFIAFDFETANRSRHSICSVGMVFVENGKIVDSLYELIDPEESFDGFNINIHGITPQDVEGAQTFDAFYHSIKEKIENKLMVAHNLSFDGYALRDNLARYGVKPVYNQFLCTYQMSRKMVTGLPAYKLSSVCTHFGIELENHHHAADDAEACAHIMLKLAEEYEVTDFDSLYNKTRITPGEISEGTYRSSLVKKFPKKLDMREFQASKDADPNHDFYGKNIVFTGELKYFSRAEAAKMAAGCGGQPQNSVTAKTHYIILGNYEDVMIKGKKSSKIMKAEKLINDGKKVEIISEEDFLKKVYG
ncbi:exonuclease domain-containing protein [Rossellomorea aquimaris]|uniref:DNA polymerase III subunit epsilon n=1 Tax=Rossellomorea aquimaris TaxID=189382 RepID=A0A1J6WLA7_9BACI|nr:exonuclease domain-containing protein [Rossellomorea aquimaris]OIU68759.1 DNA polymerase III subunit epsilon [Rossellomorea aquimaris]